MSSSGTAGLAQRKIERFGWKPDLPDHRDSRVSYGLADVRALPSSVDLRAKMPPVYDQGKIGSCTANAIGAALEYHEIAPAMPSRLFIYWNERFMENTVPLDAGAQIRDGIKVAASLGACSEDIWPYDISQFATRPSDAAFAAATATRALTYARVDQDQFQIKAALAAGNPVVVGITVYESFETEQVATTGDVPLPTATEQCLGGHAVLVVGYDDAAGRWIVRNSWGPAWGLNGYFLLPYAYLTTPGLGQDYWQIEAVGT